MIYEEKFEQFTVYKSDVSNSFLYVNFSDPDRFMDGLSDYVLKSLDDFIDLSEFQKQDVEAK